MADFVPKNLANGQLPNSKTTLFTASTTAIIRGILLVNTSAADVTVNFYINFGTGSRRILPVNMTVAAYGSSYCSDVMVMMETGDLLEGSASTANVVDYVISGVQSV